MLEVADFLAKEDRLGLTGVAAQSIETKGAKSVSCDCNEGDGNSGNGTWASVDHAQAYVPQIALICRVAAESDFSGDRTDRLSAGVPTT